MTEPTPPTPGTGTPHRWKILTWILMTGAIVLPPEITSILMLALIGHAFAHHHMEPRTAWGAALLPLLGISLLGLTGIVRFPLADVFKDFWYYSLPATTLLAGWVLSRKWTSAGLQRQIAAFGTCVALVFLAKAVWIALTLGITLQNRYAWRMAMGGDFVPVWAFFALLHMALAGRSRASRLILPGLAINLLFVLVTDSRTALSFILAGVFLILIPPRLGKWRRIYWMAGACAAAVVVLLLVFGGDSSNSFLEALQKPLQEQFSSSFDTQKDINANYRAFEALAALRAFLEGSWWDKLCGHGFGKTVDLGILMTLGGGGKGTELQFIPILHNGYLSLLVKTGVAGLATYLVFLVRTFAAFRRFKATRDTEFWAQTGMAILLGTVLATQVISGPYNKGGFFSTFLILGCALQQCFGRPGYPPKASTRS